MEQGSLYPALHRLEDRGLLSLGMGREREQPQGKVLPAHAKGRKELSAAAGRWRRMTRAIGLILGDSIESAGE